jgi:aspartate racemase
MEKALGVIGGFATESITDFLNNLIVKTSDRLAQEQVRIFVDYNTKYLNFKPDLLQNKKAMYEELLNSAKVMEKIGADYIVIPCIEAHYYLPLLKDKVNVKFVDALEETGEFLKRNRRKDSIVGILATTDAIETGMFKEYLHNFRLIYLPKEMQEKLVMEAICDKSKNETEARKLLKDAAGYLIYMGAQLLIAGNTRISMVLRQEHVGVCMVDPVKMLLSKVIDIFAG